jgi:hypothetical protein
MAEQTLKAMHERGPAVQYDFYIPTEIWDTPRMQAFLARLLAVEPSATIMGNMLGVWEGSREQTRIFRLILSEGRFERERVAQAFQSEIAHLLVELSASDVPQEAFMFTETAVIRNLTSLA